MFANNLLAQNLTAHLPSPVRSIFWMIENAYLEAQKNEVPGEILNSAFALHIRKALNGKLGLCENCGAEISEKVFKRNPFSVVCKDDCAIEIMRKSNLTFFIGKKEFVPLKKQLLANIDMKNEQVKKSSDLRSFKGNLFVGAVEVNIKTHSEITASSLLAFSLSDGQVSHTIKAEFFKNCHEVLAGVRKNFQERNLILVC